VAGCGGSDLVLPSSGDAGSIRVVSGDGQQARVGAPLTAPVVVEVTDGQDAPVAGVTVQFALTSAGEGAEVTPDTVRTNAAGRAQAYVLLGDKVGLQTGEARVMGAAGDLPSTTFVALAVPDTGPSGSPPSADFTWRCDALTCRFTDASTDADGSVTAWLWRFGDGSTSTEASPSHQYGEAGTYGVTLTVTDDAGGSDIVTNQVTVNAAPPANDPPEADFSVSCRQRTCSFTDHSSDPDGSVAGWAWDFGDGATSTARNPSRTYATPGQYTVTLRVTDDAGAHATRTRTATATAPAPEPNEPPRAGFSVTCRELTCTFTDRSSDPDGSIASRQWDFGDGGSSTDRSPSHQFAEAGSYHVTLTVTDNDGATGAASNQVTPTAPPANVPPHAEFAVSCEQLTCRFTDQSADPDGTITSRVWDFGDGATSTERSPSHTYAAGGQYNVTLRVTDDHGAQDTRTHPASPTAPPPEPNAPPHADFKVRCHKLACAFEDTSTDADGTVVAWQWSFGDGATSSERNPTHDYADRGHYDVQLTVTDDDGATSSVTHRVDPKR
jgi:PKD repeat protein